jgi:hypothetical protein
MEPELEVDLSPLDPGDWAARASKVAARGLELRRLRRTVVRRGAVALVLAAAGLVILLSAPRRTEVPRPHADLLDWAVRDVSPADVLDLEVSHAQ